MKINLNNKKALVGGSSKGLGYAVAKQLASCGAIVTMVSRNESLLKKNIIELKKLTGNDHNYILVDYNNTKKYKEIINDFFKANSVDILINNTQGPPAGDVLTVSELDYENSFNLLFQNTINTSMAALKGMKKNGWGRIINMTSISVKEPLSYLALSKARVYHLTYDLLIVRNKNLGLRIQRLLVPDLLVLMTCIFSCHYGLCLLIGTYLFVGCSLFILHNKNTTTPYASATSPNESKISTTGNRHLSLCTVYSSFLVYLTKISIHITQIHLLVYQLQITISLMLNP